MTAWKLRRNEHDTATAVFVAPAADQTFQNTGSLMLTKAEADEFEAKLTGKADLSPEEYNRLMEFLMEWAAQDTEALYLADMVKNRFGASVRRRARADDQG